MRPAAAVPDNTEPETETDSGDSFNPGAWFNASDSGGWVDTAADAVDSINPVAIMERYSVQNNQTDNAAAFLAMLSHAEGTDKGADPYAVCYGYKHTIQSFADHPKLTGEWQGESLANLGPSYVGKISTAAGRYQIIRATWQGCKRALALPDFSPDSQDKAALYLIRQRGALDLVQAGRFDEAVAVCSKEWASLPGANAPGQGMRKLDGLRLAFEQAGGVLA